MHIPKIVPIDTTLHAHGSNQWEAAVSLSKQQSRQCDGTMPKGHASYRQGTP